RIRTRLSQQSLMIWPAAAGPVSLGQGFACAGSAPAVVGVCRGSSTGRMGDQRWQGRNKEKEGEEECWDQVSGLWGDQSSLCQEAPQEDRAYGRCGAARHHVFRFVSVPSATNMEDRRADQHLP